MMRPPNMVMLVLAALLAADAARADSLLLRGSSIVLEDCRVRSISGGEVIFAGPGGRRMQRHVEDVIAIVFDGIEELDRAEQAMLEEDFGRAAKWFVLAVAEAESDLQTKWIHARLARAHAAAGDYVQAAGHAATVFALEDHPAWKWLAPVGEPDAPGYPAAAEAYQRLRSARRSVESSELVGLIDEMMVRVRRARDQAEKNWTGGRIDPRRTISGYSGDELDDLRASLTEVELVSGDTIVHATPDEPVEDELDEDAVASTGEGSAPEPTTEVDDEAPRETMRPVREDIESLLADGRYRIAIARCEAQLEEARGHEAAKLLHQRGLAQKGLGRTREAAISFTRCAFLHADSPAAPASLLETALIYRDHYEEPAKAGRLLRLAIQRAEQRGDDIIAGRARDVLERLRGRGSP